MLVTVLILVVHSFESSNGFDIRLIFIIASTLFARILRYYFCQISVKKKMTNILVIESRRIYSNSVFHFLTSTGVLIVRHACRGIRSMGRRKVKINCAPRDALSLFTCFYVFSFSEYFTMCRKFDADASRYASFVSRFR